MSKMSRVIDITKEDFMQRLHALLPPNLDASLTVGEQIPQGGFLPHGWSTGLRLDNYTHLTTGLFFPDPGGKWVARGANCLFTWCLCLDDVGTKCPVPTVAPTYIIRTNPATGSEQWVYVFRGIVEKGWGAGLNTAAAEAGIGDEFIAHRAHHWIRLPNSLPEQKRKEREDYAAKNNMEPDYTPAQLMYWSGNTFDYTELAKALDLSPNFEDQTPFEGVAEYDPMTGEADPVARLVEGPRLGQK